MNQFKRLMASLLVVSMLLAGLPMNAQASMVSTDEVVSAEAAATNRDKVNAFLARADVRQALVGQGVAEQAVQERVNAMTDAEVAQLAGRVDQAPAGGDFEVLGFLFTVFIILLITDIMGLTKVFPFTRSVNHR